MIVWQKLLSFWISAKVLVGSYFRSVFFHISINKFNFTAFNSNTISWVYYYPHYHNFHTGHAESWLSPKAYRKRGSKAQIYDRFHLLISNVFYLLQFSVWIGSYLCMSNTDFLINYLALCKGLILSFLLVVLDIYNFCFAISNMYNLWFWLLIFLCCITLYYYY